MSPTDGIPHRSGDPPPERSAWNTGPDSGDALPTQNGKPTRNGKASTGDSANNASTPNDASTPNSRPVSNPSCNATSSNDSSRDNGPSSKKVIHRTPDKDTPGKDSSTGDALTSPVPASGGTADGEAGPDDGSKDGSGDASAGNFADDLADDLDLSSFDLAEDAETEEERLKALYRYNILDTESEQAFDHVAHLAAYLFNAPIAAVSLIDKDRHWFKSCIGLQASELKLDTSMCARAIQSPGVTVIEDTTQVEEFACMEDVTNEPNIRFYAGAPITTTDGYRIGSLCVLDTTPRERPDDERLQHLKNLANIVVDEMELRHETRRRKKQAESLRQTAQRAEIERAAAEKARKHAEEAQRRAEEASSSKSHFLTGIAHDIRSPISAIDGFAQLLRRTSDGPHKQHAERILQATSHLRDMADTLSELAELESGSIDLDVEEVDLCPLICETTAALEGRAQDADISLDAETPDAPVYASANPQALRRVIDNLVGNGVKYCASGDRVSVRLHAPDRPDTEVCIEISDTGPGIDDEFFDIMFEPFTQHDENADGSGLGLAVTKELVQAMNGRVDVFSSADEGTTFRVFLPGSPASEHPPNEAS